MRRAAAAVILAGCALGTVIRAFEVTIDPRGIDEAIRIAFSRIETERVGFHRPYRIGVGVPPVDWIDVITPFRRVELEAETRAEAGARVFSQRDALTVLSSTGQQIDVIVEMTFHPQNTFVGVPAYPVTLEEAPEVPTTRPRTRVQPSGVEPVPRFLPRLGNTLLPFPYDGARRALRGTEPLLGGVIVNRFGIRALNAMGKYDVVVMDGGKEIARARLDFNALR